MLSGCCTSTVVRTDKLKFCVHALHLFWCVSWVDLAALSGYCVAVWQMGFVVCLHEAQKTSTCFTCKDAYSKSCRDYFFSCCTARHVMVLACAVHVLSCCRLCKLLLVVCRLRAFVLARFVSNGPASTSHWLLHRHQAGAYPPPRSHCQEPYRSDTLVPGQPGVILGFS